LTRLGADSPLKDPRIRVSSEYVFAPGVITRTEHYTAATPVEVARLTLEFASFSDDATLAGASVHFGSGTVLAFEVEGLRTCQAESTAATTNTNRPPVP